MRRAEAEAHKRRILAECRQMRLQMGLPDSPWVDRQEKDYADQLWEKMFPPFDPAPWIVFGVGAVLIGLYALFILTHLSPG